MAFDYEAAKAKYGSQRARQMEQEAKAAANPPAAAPAAGPAAPTEAPAPGKHLSQMTPEEAGIAAWGTEIDESNRQSANMTPEQRARWAMEHIESFDSQSKTQRSREEALEQWRLWDKHYDESCPPNNPYRNEQGDCAEKPDDCSPGTTKHGSKCVPWDQLPPELGGTAGGGGQAQGGGGGQYAPPPPSTFGSQIGYTGNPLTDMLLYQFNTGSQLSDPSKMNTFALGEDRQEGGTGAGADQGARTGQLLKGGGLWWQGPQEAGKDAFGGFRADVANSNAANPLSMPNTPAAKPAAAAAPTPQQIANPPASPSPTFTQTPATNMSGMLGNSFKPRESWRNKAGGAANPLEIQAF